MKLTDTFYFTYGTDGHPYKGGWTIVVAPTRDIAIQAFRIFHPDKHAGFVNCAGIYSAGEFHKTIMYKENDNLGATEQEYIYINIDRNKEEHKNGKN